MIGKWLGIVSFGGVLVASAPARAEEPKQTQKDEANEHTDGAEHEEHAGAFVADFVLGFGKVPLAVQNAPSLGEPLPRTHAGAGHITTESFLVGGAYELLPHTAFGVRMPLTIASLHPDGDADRTTASLGNLELTGEYEIDAQSYLKFVLEGAVSLPTATGANLPEDLAYRAPALVDRGAYDKGSINRAASLARGGEETALFAVRTRSASWSSRRSWGT
jgi:hypothetical protein